MSRDANGLDATSLAKAAEVAEYLGTTVNQLSRLRFEGCGPRYAKLNRSVRYRWADVFQWVEENTKTTTSQGQK